MPSFQSFQDFPHQKLFFDLKDKNYKKAKMKGGLGWMKNIARSLFNGNHYSSIIGERSEPLSRVFNDQPRHIYIYIYTIVTMEIAM